MLLTLSSRMNAMIGPIVSALRFVPPAALLPLLVILVGIGDLSKILVVAIASFFVIVPGTVDAMQKIPVNVVRVAQTLGFTGFPLIRHILIPSVLPDISRVVRGSIGLAWTYVVVSELINASNGLGFRIVVSQRFLRIDLIMVVLGCIGLIGVGSDALMFLLHRLLFPWDVPKKQ
jgi:NitT/TauT family transport system permease protein